jgi:ATP-dependent helicase/nuclease subunit A
MSVHKSKGLEFPIVFLAGTDKKFNTREFNDNIIVDSDLGFGLDVIDYEMRIKYPSISKNAIIIKSKRESLAEEMRILYVALTRAREKLFVTGLVKDINKLVLKYKSKISNYKIINSNSFLDWIGYSIYGKTNLWNVNKVYYEDLIHEANGGIGSIDAENSGDSSIINDELYNNIDMQMNWKYKYLDSTTIPSKISISEIKRMSQVNQLDEQVVSNLELVSKPEFLQEDVTSGASYGTLVHFVFQHINFKHYDEAAIKEIIEGATQNEFLRTQLIKVVNEFSKTDLFNSLLYAKEIKKEVPFNLNIKASEIYHNESYDTVMVQGIIDLYFINNEDELILVDYKTDNVQDGMELIKKYKVQLYLYKRALEEILSKKVSNSIIYSFKLNKEIKL